jgi:hypothetical protein
VAAESVKFARLFPLNQQDLPPSVLANYPNARKSWEILSSPGKAALLFYERKG